MAGSLYLGSQKVCPAIVVGGGEEKVYNATVEEIIGTIDADGKLVPSQDKLNLVFDGVEDLSSNIFEYKFYNSQNIESASFPDLVRISGTGCFSRAFYQSSIKTLSFPKLEEIPAGFSNDLCYGSLLESVDFSSVKVIKTQALMSAFGYSQVTSIDLSSLEEVDRMGVYSFLNDCPITTVRLPKLKTIHKQGLGYAFSGCWQIEDIYFNSLTTTSFENATGFVSMMYSTLDYNTHTLHFPSNLESTIQGLNGYPNFGGSNGYVVLAFDLPATE